jgi:2-amino-4-hydroxy-6-hydroxymethyldihydropteridine diphosphokinase
VIQIYIGIGSNLGDRSAHLQDALRGIRQCLDAGASISRAFETEPRMDADQPPFLNAVIEARTDLAPSAVLTALLGLERSLGRDRSHDRPKGPRLIDLDLLVHGNCVVNETGLQVPHPGIAHRRFVLAPLAELAPELEVPGLNATVGQLLRDCPDSGWVRPLQPAPKAARLGALLLLIAVLVLASGCDLRPPVQRAAGVDFDRVVRAPFRAPQRSVANPPSADAKDNEIIDILVEKRRELFERPESTVLTQAEALAARSGRQFDMIDIYRKTYDEKGAGHYVAPRLAYAYINIGLHDASRQIVDKLMKARPNDWRTWFLHGWLRGTEEQNAPMAVRETVDAWERALQLGPKDRELYGVNRAFIEKRVKDAKAMLERAR